MSFKNIIFALSIFSCPVSVVKASGFPIEPPKKNIKIKIYSQSKTSKHFAVLFSKQIPEYRDSLFRLKHK